jgi:hypothetical protein
MAGGFLYTYELMKPHPFAGTLQRQMIEEIERARPSCLVEIQCEPSWAPEPDSQRLIFEWLERYRQDFDLVKEIRVPGHAGENPAWNELVGVATGRLDPAVLVYCRKPR